MPSKDLISRRAALAGLAAASGSLITPRAALASGSVTAAIYPGTWEDAYRAIVAPLLKSRHGVDIAFDALFAVDQVAKVRAARGVPPSTASSSIRDRRRRPRPRGSSSPSTLRS